jgi:hypothetical protein
VTYPDTQSVKSPQTIQSSLQIEFCWLVVDVSISLTIHLSFKLALWDSVSLETDRVCA